MPSTIADLLRERARFATGSPNENVVHQGEMVYPEPYVRNPDDPYTFTSDPFYQVGGPAEMIREQVGRTYPVDASSNRLLESLANIADGDALRALLSRRPR